MHSQKILAFSDFLAREPKSYNEIAQYLVMNTFSEEKFNSVYIGELLETGVVCAIGGFGWSAEEHARLVSTALSTVWLAFRSAGTAVARRFCSSITSFSAKIAQSSLRM